MPIYEFVCQACGKEFDALVRLNGENDVSCPACHASELKKKMSITASAQKDCSACASSSCGSGGFS